TIYMIWKNHQKPLVTSSRQRNHFLPFPLNRLQCLEGVKMLTCLLLPNYITGVEERHTHTIRTTHTHTHTQSERHTHTHTQSERHTHTHTQSEQHTHTHTQSERHTQTHR